jgi:Tol biopolymer transport system component
VFDDRNTQSRFIWSGKSDQLVRGGAAIVIKRADGGRRRVLVEDGEYPSSSPDGQMVAFVREPFVYVINSDGAGERKLVRFDSAYECSDILWSGDSRKIACTTTAWKNPKFECETGGDCRYVDPETNTELCRVHIIDVRDNSHVQVVGGGLLGRFDRQCDIAWSPDGRRVAFTRNGFLFTVTADGKHERRLGTRGFTPSWSPDGSHIAFIRNGSMYVLDLRRQKERHLARTDEVSWSPDGKAVVIARTVNEPEQDANGGYSPGAYVIEAIDVDSGHVRRIWPTVGTCTCTEPVWQP